MFCPLGDDRVFVSVCYTPQPPNVFFTEALRRPPHITDRRVSTVHRGSEPLASSSRSDLTTLSLISSNEECGAHDIAPCLIQDQLGKFSSRCWPRLPRKNYFFRKTGQFQKTDLQSWAHRRPSRQRSAGIFGNFEGSSREYSRGTFPEIFPREWEMGPVP